MITCADCAEHIAYRDLARAALPMWVACPACKVTLVGSRFVQVVSVAMTVAAGGVLLATIVTLLFAWAPGSVATGVVLAGFLILVICQVGLFL